MRIRTKLTLATSAGGLILFAGFGTYTAFAEARALRATLEEEVLALGELTQAAVEHALRDGQRDDVIDALAHLDHATPNMEMAVLGADGRPYARSDHFEVSAARLRELASTEGDGPRMHYEPADDPTVLLVALPLQRVAADGPGTLIVTHSLAELRAERAASNRATAISVGVFAVVVTAIGVILGQLYIGRPIDRLLAAIQGVRKGELGQTVAAERVDEFHALFGAFNEMSRELAAARERLAGEAGERAKLERSLEEADRMIAIGELAASLAHEIGSPLQVLGGRARALASRDYDAERVRANAEIIASQSERIAGIVENLLSYVRRRPAASQTPDPSATIRAVIELLDVDAKRRRVRLVAPVGKAPALRCDPAHLQQITFNLVKNAMDATAEGGTVDIALRTTADRVAIEIRDTGCGIADDVLPRVFEPLFTTRADSGGTGLGLAVVKSLVDRHGGEIAVESREGHGTTFTVTLQRVEASAA